MYPFTLNASDREVYDDVVKTLKNKVKKHKAAINQACAKIAEGIDDSGHLLLMAGYASILLDTVYYFVFTKALEGLEENDINITYTWDQRVPRVFKHAYNQVKNRALSPTFSTNPMVNIEALYELQAWTEIMVLIDENFNVMDEKGE